MACEGIPRASNILLKYLKVLNRIFLICNLIATFYGNSTALGKILNKRANQLQI